MAWSEVNGGGGKFTSPVGSDARSEIKRDGRAGSGIIVGKGDVVGEFFSRLAELGVGGEGEGGLGSGTDGGGRRGSCGEGGL